MASLDDLTEALLCEQHATVFAAAGAASLKLKFNQHGHQINLRACEMINGRGNK